MAPRPGPRRLAPPHRPRAVRRSTGSSTTPTPTTYLGLDRGAARAHAVPARGRRPHRLLGAAQRAPPGRGHRGAAARAPPRRGPRHRPGPAHLRPRQRRRRRGSSRPTAVCSRTSAATRSATGYRPAAEPPPRAAGVLGWRDDRLHPAPPSSSRPTGASTCSPSRTARHPSPVPARCSSRSPPPASTSSTSTSARASTRRRRRSWAGNEGAGTVVATGDGRRRPSSPATAWPGPRSLGSAARFAALPASGLVLVPDGVDLETAAAVMLQGLTAHYLTTSTYAVQPGRRRARARRGRRGRPAARADGAGARRLGRRHGRRTREVRDRPRPRCRPRHRLPRGRRPRGRGARGSPTGAGSTWPTTASARTPSTRRWPRCGPAGCSRCSAPPAGRCRRSTSSGSTAAGRCS